MAAIDRKVKLNVHRFEEYQRMNNLGESEAAAEMGISREQLWRAKNGATVGAAFIASTMSLFVTAEFRDLFYTECCMHANKNTGRAKNAG